MVNDGVYVEWLAAINRKALVVHMDYAPLVTMAHARIDPGA